MPPFSPSHLPNSDSRHLLVILVAKHIVTGNLLRLLHFSKLSDTPFLCSGEALKLQFVFIVFPWSHNNSLALTECLIVAVTVFSTSGGFYGCCLLSLKHPRQASSSESCPCRSRPHQSSGPLPPPGSLGDLHQIQRRRSTQKMMHLPAGD